MTDLTGYNEISSRIDVQVESAFTGLVRCQEEGIHKSRHPNSLRRALAWLSGCVKY